MKANVKSIEAIRNFKAELQTYNDSLRQTLDMLTSELTKAVVYFESDRSTYWPAQARKASDKVSEARINLERCQVTTSPGEGPSCYEEKKALRHAKERLAFAEERVRATRKWLVVVRKEVHEFRSRMAQLSFLTESELPRSVALLERLATRLERYTSTSPLNASNHDPNGS